MLHFERLMEAIDIQRFKEAVGRRIFALRKAKGYSSRKLAILADMEHHQVLAIEKGNTDMRLSTLFKICVALEVQAQVILTDDIKDQ